MKISTLGKTTMAMCFMAMMGSSARATLFTAIANGNFSSTTTWQGGVIPNLSIIGDQIVIPGGITVMLDQTQTINGTVAALTVDGTLTSTGSNALILTSGAFGGTGTVNVDSMALGLSTGFTFNGTINAQRFTSTGATIASSATVNVVSKLQLAAGTLNLNSGSLTLSNGSMILVSGGNMMANGGTYNLMNAYNVIYSNSTANTGLETSGSGLTDVEVNVPVTSNVNMSSDMTVRGTLKLTSGNLNTNGNDLIFVNNADFSASGTGLIAATTGTDITITSANNFNGGLRFSSTGNTIDNLTINMSNNASRAMIATNLTVNGTLNLQAGRLHIGGSTLTVGNSGMMTGGSANSYVITGVNGRLVASLGAGVTNTYHVGSTNYAPAIITGNTGSASGSVGVGVNDSIYSAGTSGTNLSLTQRGVNATWYITHTATSGIDLKLQTMWSSNMEVNSFDRTKLYLSHYTNNAWDVNTTASATTATNGMFTTSRDHITSLSPFAVMGEGANTNSIKTLAGATIISVYPNPTADDIHVTGKYNHAKIYNLSGTMVKSTDFNNTITVSELPNGVYTVLLNGADATATARFIKQ